MATVRRFYYSDSISGFLEKNNMEILGKLSYDCPHNVNDETSASWLEEIKILKEVLLEYKERGSIFFEYNIPRMGRRADVILLIENIVFVIEFKTAEQKFSREAVIQVWDYAIDLKNFQEGCLNRVMIPILVAPKEKDANCLLQLNAFEDQVYNPLLSNKRRLHECITTVIKTVPHDNNSCYFDDLRWAKSGYSPTPTIIEAAVALYEEHNVEEITKHDGEIVETSKAISEIITFCKQHRKKAICFVTGVPGAGKTLIGLETAIDQFNNGEKAVYLSGNFPLVEVLQEALTRDYVRRTKEDFKSGKTEQKPCNKSEAKSKVKAFIQMIHHYGDLYLEGTEIRNGKIVEIPGYFQDRQDLAFVPVENIAIFDEAQRAWTKNELSRFMKEKKHIDNFPYSEPAYLISCMDRHEDWAVIICLIGNGQEINKGEAGLLEWLNALCSDFKNWEIYLSSQIYESSLKGENAILKLKDSPRFHVNPALHLAMSMRSFRAEKVSLFVQQLLDLKMSDASETLKDIKNYPIVLTRSLEKGKMWLRAHARGSERYGLLACSKAERLKAISVNVRYQPDFVHWFLEDESDIRSSNCLEDTLTEFKVQGLEIDWACVVWDADLRLDETQSHWQHFQLRSGSKWQKINKSINQEYHINAYRVLLTRARQGMVIVVPHGDEGNPPDLTRKPEWYDGIYNYLRDVGLKEI